MGKDSGTDGARAPTAGAPLKGLRPTEENGMLVRAETVGAVSGSVHLGQWPSLENADYRDAAERDAAHQIVEHLRRAGYIKFHTQSDGMGIRLTAVLTAAHPSAMTPIERRIEDRQWEIANELAAAAATAIRAWNSYYTGGGGNISKDQAVDAIFGARRNIEERLRRDAEGSRAAASDHPT